MRRAGSRLRRFPPLPLPGWHGGAETRLAGGPGKGAKSRGSSGL